MNEHNDCKPLVSSPHVPQKTMPTGCFTEKVAAYIDDLQSGAVDFWTVKPDSTVPENQRGYQTMDDNGNMFRCEYDNPSYSPNGYIWKQLSDYPNVIGISSLIKYDHRPHYHPQEECYYVVKGTMHTLAAGSYHTLNQGDYFKIPSYAIHNTPVFDEDGAVFLYWFPKDSHFNKFKYFWKDSFSNTAEIVKSAFDTVDNIRLRELELRPYGENVRAFRRRWSCADTTELVKRPPFFEDCGNEILSRELIEDLSEDSSKGKREKRATNVPERKKRRASSSF